MAAILQPLPGLPSFANTYRQAFPNDEIQRPLSIALPYRKPLEIQSYTYATHPLLQGNQVGSTKDVDPYLIPKRHQRYLDPADKDNTTLKSGVANNVSNTIAANGVGPLPNLAPSANLAPAPLPASSGVGRAFRAGVNGFATVASAANTGLNTGLNVVNTGLNVVNTGINVARTGYDVVYGATELGLHGIRVGRDYVNQTGQIIRDHAHLRGPEGQYYREDEFYEPRTGDTDSEGEDFGDEFGDDDESGEEFYPAEEFNQIRARPPLDVEEVRRRREQHFQTLIPPPRPTVETSNLPIVPPVQPGGFERDVLTEQLRRTQPIAPVIIDEEKYRPAMSTTPADLEVPFDSGGMQVPRVTAGPTSRISLPIPALTRGVETQTTAPVANPLLPGLAEEEQIEEEAGPSQPTYLSPTQASLAKQRYSAPGEETPAERRRRLKSQKDRENIMKRIIVAGLHKRQIYEAVSNKTGRKRQVENLELDQLEAMARDLNIDY